MPPQSWLEGSSAVSASTAVVAGATLGFYVVEKCSTVDCPFGHDVADTGKPGGFPAYLQTGAQMRALKRLVQGRWSARGWADIYGCILQSQATCIALIVCVWALLLIALLVLLSWVVPKPRREELHSFRNTSAVFLLQAAFMLSYIVAVSQEGYADATTVLLLWSFKFASRQLSTLLPLRSAAIKRAHNIKVQQLLGMLLAYTACTVAHGWASYLFLRHMALISPIVKFELWSAPLGILTFGHLALLEGLHMAEELSMRAVMKGHPPFMTPDRRAEVADYITLFHGVSRGVTVCCHRIQMLRSFGIQWRLGDFVLLADARISSQRVLRSVELHLQNSLSHIQIDHHYLSATAEEVHEVQTCAICHGGMRHGFQRRLVMPKKLPCGHVFHLGCLRRWMIHSLGKEASCPMCRSPLPNALEARDADCWQAKAAASIRWWLDWPRQHALSMFQLSTVFGNRMFAAPPGGLAEYIEGPPTDAAAAAATMADAAQPPELRSRLRAVTMNSRADPDLARRMLEGYLTVRESLERREGLYTVIGHAEGAEGAGVLPEGGRPHRPGTGAGPAPQPHGEPGRAGGSGAAEAARQPEPQGGGAGGRGGAGHLHGAGGEGGAGGGPGHLRERGNGQVEADGGVAEASIASELVAMALSSPLLGMLATGAVDGDGGDLFGADAHERDQAENQSQ